MSLVTTSAETLAERSVLILQVSANGIWTDQEGYEWPQTEQGLKAARKKAEDCSYRCRVLSVTTTVRVMSS